MRSRGRTRVQERYRRGVEGGGRVLPACLLSRYAGKLRSGAYFRARVAATAGRAPSFRHRLADDKFLSNENASHALFFTYGGK